MSVEKSLNRRRFLQSLGAAAPIFLPIIRSERLFAQVGSNKRFLLYFTFNGCPQDGFVPTGFNNDTTQNFNKSFVLQPLEAHRTEINVISGVRTYNAVDKHAGHYNAAGWLTGCTPGNYKNDGMEAVDRTVSNESLDSAISRATGKNKLASFGIVPALSTYSVLTWNQSLQRVNPIPNPKDTWTNLFSSGFGDVADPTEFNKAKSRRIALYDALNSDLNSARRFLNLDEKEKIEGHIAAVLGLKKEIEQLQFEGGSTCNYTAPTGTFGLKDQAVKDVSPAIRDLIANLQIAMAVEALSCGIISTATIVAGSSGARSNLTFNDLTGPGGQKVNSGWHNASHHKELGAKAKADHIAINRWHASNVAKIVASLKTKNIFSQSCVVWGNEFGDTNRSHTYNDLSMVVAGSLGGYLKVGQYLQLPGRGGNNTYNQTSILTAIGRGFGVLNNSQKWGDPRWAQDPIPGLVA
ncbi:MAG: DUF1552 domain-containing protein [Oligoflexales bacterium]|nr:DUF1552 domain-containing protein [Oligoflexales bacterium]